MNHAPIVQDEGTATLSALITREQVLQADRRGLSEVVAVTHTLRSSLPGRSTRLLPRDAAPFLIELRARLEERTRRDARGYSPFRWLWYLRRLPDFVTEGRVSTTLAYTLALAETLTADSPGNDAPLLRDQWISFKLDEHVARHVLMLACRTRFIFSAHSSIRKAGKGCDLVFDVNGLPAMDCAEGVTRSMMLYDDRNTLSQQLLARAGTPLPMVPAWDNSGRALLACFRIDPQLLEVPDPRNGERDVRIRAQFKPVLVSVDHLKQFNARFGRLRWWQPEAVALTLLLALAAHLLFRLPNSPFSLLQFGYLATSAEVLHAVWNDHGPQAAALTAEILDTPVTIASLEDLLKELRLVRGSTWPLSAPSPIRGGDELLALDLHSATMRLATAFEFPATNGGVANERAHHFELEIQHLLDHSAWRPTDGIRPIRGRTLRCGGHDLTDIDAVGERDGRLLLVSAKSRVYNALYDAGDHAQIRNAAQGIAESVARWRDVTNFLAAHPLGDNYNLTGVQEFIGVVCTPHVVWTPLGGATAEVASGLRAACSVEELERWVAL